ncbi:MAG: hypothetical protein IIU28_07510 [Lachnospiraceae bacterium]|nr:hypothetical protein [Lachnospiraceae bacterium]
MLKHKKRVPDLLCLALFILIFINGFESGGYQASLHTIGKVYDLSITSMGLFATVELFLPCWHLSFWEAGRIMSVRKRA